MPQTDGSLSQLLSNPENLNLLFEIAAAGKTAEPPPPEPSPDMQQLLSLLTAGHQEDEGRESIPPPSSEEGTSSGNQFSMLSQILPQLLQIMRGDANALPKDRVNLVHAIKPYASGKTEHIDRAVRMAGIAKAAKSALGMLGKG